MAEIGRIEPVQFLVGIFGSRRGRDGVYHRRVALGNLAEEADQQTDDEQYREQEQYGDPTANPSTSFP